MDSDFHGAHAQDMGLGSSSCCGMCSGAACGRLENSSDYFSRGVERLRAGKYKGAIADFDQVINIRPKYTNAYINRADAKIRLGQHRGGDRRL